MRFLLLNHPFRINLYAYLTAAFLLVLVSFWVSGDSLLVRFFGIAIVLLPLWFVLQDEFPWDLYQFLAPRLIRPDDPLCYLWPVAVERASPVAKHPKWCLNLDQVKDFDDLTQSYYDQVIQQGRSPIVAEVQAMNRWANGERERRECREAQETAEQEACHRLQKDFRQFQQDIGPSF